MAEFDIPNVPDDVRRRLTDPAEREGRTLSDSARLEQRRSRGRRTRAEVLARIDELPGRDYRGETAAESTRATRDEG